MKRGAIVTRERGIGIEAAKPRRVKRGDLTTLRRRVAELEIRLESSERALETLGAAWWTVMRPYAESYIRYAIERAVDNQILKIDERLTDARIDARRSGPHPRTTKPKRGERRR